MGKAAMLCIFLVIVQTREDMIFITRANPRESRMLEHLRQELIADNMDYDSINTTTSSTTHLPVKVFNPREHSRTTHNRIQRYIPQQVPSIPLLLYGINRKVTSSEILNRSPKNRKKFEIYPQQLSTKSDIGKKTALITKPSDKRNLLQNFKYRRNHDHSQNHSQVKTPLTDALKEGIKLVEKFEQGKMAKKQFLNNWMVMNDIIQNAIKTEQLDKPNQTPKDDTIPSNLLALLREKLTHNSNDENESLRKNQSDSIKLTLRQKSDDDIITEKRQATTLLSLDKQLRLHRKDKDKHFLAYRYKPTTRSKARRSSKTYKIYAAYKKSTKNLMHEDTEEETSKSETSKSGLRQEDKEPETTRKSHTHPQTTLLLTTRKTIKGFKLMNEAKDVLDESYTLDDDSPWQEEPIIEKRKEKKRQEQTTQIKSTTQTLKPLLEVSWVKHQEKKKKSATQKIEPLQDDENKKDVPEHNTAQENKDKTMQEVKNENLSQKLRQQKKNDAHKEIPLQSKVEGSRYVDQIIKHLPIENLQNKNKTIHSQVENEDSSQEKPIKKQQRLYDISSPQEEFTEIKPNIDEDKSPQVKSKEITVVIKNDRQQTYKKKQQNSKNIEPQIEPKQEPVHHSEHEISEMEHEIPERKDKVPIASEDMLAADMQRNAGTNIPLQIIVKKKERLTNASTALRTNPDSYRWYAHGLLD